MPAFENITLPITQIMATVRSGKSQYKDAAKSIKNVQKMLAGFMQAKINAMDNKKDKLADVEATMNIDQYFFHYVCQTYGLDQLAVKYSEMYLCSINKHR